MPVKKKRQNRPSEIRLSGVPPIIPIKTQNHKKKETQNHQKNKGQNRPSEIRLAGVPPIMAIKTQNYQKNKGHKPLIWYALGMHWGLITCYWCAPDMIWYAFDIHWYA